MTYPWTAENTLFFKAQKDVIRKKVIADLQAVIT
jgi:hypothetical protein